jgi:hypothetical protein
MSDAGTTAPTPGQLRCPLLRVLFGPSPTGVGWLVFTTIPRTFNCVAQTQLCEAGFPVRFRVTATSPMHCHGAAGQAARVGLAVTGFTSWVGIAPTR